MFRSAPYFFAPIIKMKNLFSVLFVCLLLVSGSACADEKAIKEEADSLFGVGLMYYQGDDIQKDYLEARTFFEKAADLGSKDALFYLGEMYKEGYGVKQDYPKARDYFDKAAQRRQNDARVSLGVMYKEGLGVKIDLVHARAWFELACENGSQKGCTALKKLKSNSGQ